MREAIVEIDRLAHRYRMVGSLRPPFVRHVEALQGLDLRVRAGTVAGVVGPNGSGKTTLMRVVLGLVRPTGGSVSVFGHEPGALAARRLTGYAAEEPEFLGRLTGRAFLGLAGRLYGCRGKDLVDRVDRIIKTMGLEETQRRSIATYSKGMRRRLSLAQALLHGPALVLLDEPFEGLDPIGCVTLREIVRRQAESGTALIVTSHRLADIQLVADEVTVLDRGRTLLQGPTEEILSDAGRWEIVAEGLDPARRDEVLAVIRRAGGTVVRSGCPQTTLEELFLRLLGERPGDPRS